MSRSKRCAGTLILLLLCWPGRSSLGLLDERDLVSPPLQPVAWPKTGPKGVRRRDVDVADFLKQV